MTSLALVSPLSISSYLFVIPIFNFIYSIYLSILTLLDIYLRNLKCKYEAQTNIRWAGRIHSILAHQCHVSLPPSLSRTHSVSSLSYFPSLFPAPSFLMISVSSFSSLYVFFLFFIRTDVFEDVTSIRPLLKYMYLLNWGMGKKIRKLRRREVRDER